ncbi:ligand-dependent corepressor isoform X3 [Amblyraja radiata]|nr:ligand-dependent corepressor isoform X3 [Amblyraja radiata]XP_032890002.1 ligand-dependent corepressor isoform X3 [Amblyraja radiata]XP_032890004.1 ligand-dependent corepressor isoform X3 [Amblyraja radiata]XP_032890005.1 ligand-dependent corepressor isoform X3 [Amblyraja radiata]
MHQMIREFAAEYTSKTSTSQDSIVLSSTKDQSTSKTPVLGACALNPVLSELLMADQDRPLDLTVKKSNSESDSQDGVLDLSTKKSSCAGTVSETKFVDCSSSAVLAKGHNEIPTQEVQLGNESQGSLDQFMAKLCRRHQKQFMSVLGHMHSGTGPESESVANEDMAASNPAVLQQQPKDSGEPLPSRPTFPSRPSFNRVVPTQNETNCTNVEEDRLLPSEVGNEICGVTSVESPAALGSSSGGTLTKNSTVGAKPSSKGTFTTNCSKTVSLEALQNETVNNRKLISNSLLGLSPSDCALIGTANRLEGLSSCNQKSKTEETGSAKGQKEGLRALPMQLLNQRKNLARSQNGPQSSSGAIKRAPVQEHTTSAKRNVKGNHVLPTTAGAKDCWILSKSSASGRGANGHLRLKVQSPPTRAARKSTRVAVPRSRSSVSTMCQYVNEHDNQCDIVYISKPITECRFDGQRSWSSTRKTARKSTRGHLCNEEYWELKTVRTSARNSTIEVGRETCAPKVPAPVTLKPVITLPVSVPVAGAPVAIGTGVHCPKGQEKTLLMQDQVQGLEESLNNYSANSAEQLFGTSPTCGLQEASLSSMNDNSPQGEQKRPAAHADSPISENCPAEIRAMEVPNIDTSECVVVPAESRDQSNSSSAAYVSVEPRDQLLEECRDTEWDLSTLDKLSKDSNEVKCNSPADSKSSPNHSEAIVNNGSQELSMSSLENASISPVNSIEISLSPREQCNKQNNSSSEILNGDLGKVSNNVCKATVESQQPECSVENVDTVKVEKLLIEKEDSQGSPVTLRLPSKPVACSPEAKSDLHPQPASAHASKRRGSDSGRSTPEMVGRCSEGTDGIECHVTPSSPCWTEIEQEDLGANAPDHKRKEDVMAERSLQPGRSISPNKEETPMPDASVKKRQRKKLVPASTDRRLRSQQSQPQTVASPGDTVEKPLVCADGLLVPCLNVKFPRNQGEKKYRREVCISRVASVQFPVDCFNKTLLQSIIDPESKVDESLASTSVKDGGKTGQPAAMPASSDLPAKESENSEDDELINDAFLPENVLLEQGRILEVCVDVQSAEERQVSFSNQNAETDRVSDYSSGSVDDGSTASQQQASSRRTNTHKESTKRAGAGLVKRLINFGSPHQTAKGMHAKLSPGDKKNASHDLRCLNMPINEPESSVLEEDVEDTDNKLPTQDIQEDEASELVGMNDADATEVSRPKFLDWCSEDENQELITTLNAKYESLHKSWTQMEKEGPVIHKARSKSDRLKEIWKSRKRARKVRGLYDHKISPVQKLFVANFNMANICKWFMETTETKSLVIVKNVNARNPVVTMKPKSFLQKSSMIGIFPSPQAERLKKHLKKFAIASPARNNPKTRALLDNMRRIAMARGERVGQQQQQDMLPDAEDGLSTGDLFSANMLPDCQEEGDGPSLIRGVPQHSKHIGLKKPVSAWILRKYSNMMGKLHKFQHGKEQAGRKNPGRHKSVCMNPMVSPKLTSQTQLESPKEPLPVVPGRPEESKGKRKRTRDSPIKEPRLGRSRRSKSEAVSPSLPSKPAPKPVPASQKPKADGTSSRLPAPRKSGSGAKPSGLPVKAVKRSPSAGLKSVARGKGKSDARDGGKGKRLRAKRKGGVGREQRARQAQSKVGSPAARTKQRDKTRAKLKAKAAAPAKHRPKCEVSLEAKRKKKRKLGGKTDPVPNKRRRTDAK